MIEQYTRRDHLARDRTHLANERTFLAYLRTAFAFFATGAVLLKFYPTSNVLSITAYFCIILGFVLTIIGIDRFFIFKKNINRR